jgi:hypothetical protein
MADFELVTPGEPFIDPELNLAAPVAIIQFTEIHFHCRFTEETGNLSNRITDYNPAPVMAHR